MVRSALLRYSLPFHLTFESSALEPSLILSESGDEVSGSLRDGLIEQVYAIDFTATGTVEVRVACSTNT